MSTHKSKFTQLDSCPQEIIELYEEIVGRHDHLREALHLRLQAVALTPKILDEETQSMFMRIREATLWFMTVEFYSRFLSDPLKRNNSKRCLLALLRLVDTESDQKLEDLFKEFVNRESKVIKFIKIQRDIYFSHADEVSWDDFPRVFDKEYKKLLNEVADILDRVQQTMGLQRICTRNFRLTSIFRLKA